jgi:hypothetical protein
LRALMRFLLIISLYFSLPIAKAATGISLRMEKEIESTFLINGKVSPEKVALYRSQAKQKRAEIIANLVRYYEQIGGSSREKAIEKANESDAGLAYDRLEELSLIMLKASPANAKKIALKMLELGFALRSDGRWLTEDELKGYAKGFTKDFLVKAKNNSQEEAYNLFNPVTNQFYTQSELSQIKSKGGDLSKLDPIGDGQFYTNTKIETYKVENTYNPNSELYRGSKILFPDDNVELEYLGLRRSQSRIKMDVETIVNGVKQKYKFKILSETHSEPTAAALAAALGYNTDPTRSVRNPKLYFNKVSKAEFLRDLESYYGWWEPQWNVVKEGRDAKGDYIIFREGLLEAKVSSVNRIGSWSFNKNSSPDHREVRGLSIFAAWLANSDMKEEGQTKLILKDNDSPESMYYSLNDLGWGFGSFMYPESIGFFKWNPIKRISEKGVSLNYMTWRWSDLFDGITYDDARWIIRRMARLSRAQISAAVALGKWDKKVEAVVIEKLIARRNAFVKAFNLEKEISESRVDFSLAPSDEQAEKSKTGGKAPAQNLPDFMKTPLSSIIGPSLLAIESTLLNTVIKEGTNAIEREVLFKGDDLWGTNIPFATGLILKVRRKIAKNEEPRSIMERYLVHDEVTLGWVLGAGSIDVSGKAIYYRSFNLIYPSKERRTGLYFPNYIANLFLPYAPGFTKLPEKYSLFIQDYIEGSGTVRISNKSIFSLGAQASLSRIFLRRFLIGDRGNGFVNIMEDKSQATKVSGEINAALAFIKFPMVVGSVEKGSIDREIWKVTNNSVNSNARFFESVRNLVGWLDVSSFSEIAEKRRIKSDYITNRYGINLFSLIFSNNSYRKDDISEHEGEDDKLAQKSLQIERISDEVWNLPITNQEQNVVRSFFLGVKDEKNGFSKPVLGLNVKILDGKSSSKEFKGEYLDFVNRAANNPYFIPFSPILHTNRDEWGVLLTQFDFLIYEKAIARLLSVSEDELWSDFRSVTGYQPDGFPSNTGDLRKDTMINKWNAVVHNLMQARGPIPRERMANRLVSAIQNAVVSTSMSTGVKGDLVGVLKSILGDEEYFISAKIGTPIYAENIFPEGKPLVNRIGVLKYRDPTLHNFSMGGISDIFNFFDSIIPHNSQVPSTDYPY